MTRPPSLPNTKVLTLRTIRLDLLPIHRGHATAMFEVLNDASLYRYVSGSPPSNAEELARGYEFWENRRSPDGTELWLNWAVQLRTDRQFIGHLQAGVLPAHADIAWFVGSHWQRQGYATEAAQAVLGFLLKLGVREVHASINPAHTASI